MKQDQNAVAVTLIIKAPYRANFTEFNFTTTLDFSINR